ncbi:dual specificity protein phosphatase 3 [Lingula anatina]|uniref:Dual specificity protein phosphatase n=1 Tax=Lingula anatina TaxID=7574 RepID=A0A1S3H020_LINAN|nr:dual specificity protein phosphatase 3-like [Lingula anatina]XP_013381829.1 dual specificity protein phosphatase 3 [Lingula anatina]|eukprot:XP_013379348.1 dual specificity protein phosphatase 3-like [Lingula anatina]
MAERVSSPCTVEKLKKIIQDVRPSSSRPPDKTKNRKDPTWSAILQIQAHSMTNRYNEVYPGIFLGDHSLAKNKEELVSLGITHLLNAAEGTKFNQISTNQEYYQDVNIKYFGIHGQDVMTFKLSKYFKEAADFIDECLKSGGKIYVHCFEGVSRSATLVTSYLMLKQGQTAVDALTLLRQKREVMPNTGFMKQLCELDEELRVH